MVNHLVIQKVNILFNLLIYIYIYYNYFIIDSEKENEFERNENNKIPKEQLKLNLSPVINPLDFKKCEEIKGFHEEFMSKLEEFSQSWRTAALAEKKF